MPQRILLTGRPGVGKTTLVRRVLERLSRPARGFFTQEVRRQGRRVGFQVITLEGKRAWLARAQPGPGPRIGRYRVDLEAFEALVLPELQPRAQDPPELLWVVDEIGPMELLSRPFRQVILTLFQSPWDLLATVVLRPHPFADALKARQDVECLEVTEANRDALVHHLVQLLTHPASGPEVLSD